MRKRLSPQAQAVAQAARAAYWLPDQECPGEPDTIAAAALRAAAQRVTDLVPDLGSGKYTQGVEDSAAFLEAIAAELESGG